MFCKCVTCGLKTLRSRHERELPFFLYIGWKVPKFATNSVSKMCTMIIHCKYSFEMYMWKKKLFVTVTFAFYSGFNEMPHCALTVHWNWKSPIGSYSEVRKSETFVSLQIMQNISLQVMLWAIPWFQHNRYLLLLLWSQHGLHIGLFLLEFK